MKKILALAIISGLISGYSCNSGGSNGSGGGNTDIPPTPVIPYSVVATLPHDSSYFTEGLEFYKGKLMESTGLEGKSRLVKYDITSGKVDHQIALDPKFFGEGITVFSRGYTFSGLRELHKSLSSFNHFTDFLSNNRSQRYTHTTHTNCTKYIRADLFYDRHFFFAQSNIS